MGYERGYASVGSDEFVEEWAWEECLGLESCSYQSHFIQEAGFPLYYLRITSEFQNSDNEGYSKSFMCKGNL